MKDFKKKRYPGLKWHLLPALLLLYLPSVLLVAFVALVRLSIHQQLRKWRYWGLRPG